MKFDLPFSDVTITQLVGNTVVLSEHHRSRSRFKPFSVLSVKSGGDVAGGHFEVENGILRLMDGNGLCYRFDGLETRNGVVYAIGSDAKTTSKDGHDRIVMHEQRLLGNNFGICISSTVNYAEKTLIPLLESIRKANFDMSKVVVVVGGFRGDKTDMMEGAKVIYRQNDEQALNGLAGTDDSMPYWLMLPDTCEVERNIMSLITGVDIGLSPDMIMLRSDIKDWMGFYSSSFIDRIRGDLGGTFNGSSSVIDSNALVTTTIEGTVTELGKRDIYGMGNTRLIKKINAVGIRRFDRATGRKTP